MYKHYITQVKDIAPFRADLLADYDRVLNSTDDDEPPTYVKLRENGEPYINLKTANVIPSKGVKTVAIMRMIEQQADWFENVSKHTSILAKAKHQKIITIDDCEGVASNWKGVYHSIFKQDPINDSDVGVYLPPEIHCVLR